MSTGIRYREGKLLWTELDIDALRDLARVGTYGAEVHDSRDGSGNWRKIPAEQFRKDCMNSAWRHLAELSSNSIADKDSWLHHGSLLAWNALGIVVVDMNMLKQYVPPEDAMLFSRAKEIRIKKESQAK